VRESGYNLKDRATGGGSNIIYEETWFMFCFCLLLTHFVLETGTANYCPPTKSILLCVFKLGFIGTHYKGGVE